MFNPALYMLVGIPGSGKSTWINTAEFRKEFDTTIVSTDSYIDNIAMYNNQTYNEAFQNNIKAAEKHMYEDVNWAIEHNTNIVWDQTNLNRKARAKKLITIPDRYTKIAVVFSTPEPKELERRLNSRIGKTIPEHVITSMINNFECPQFDEGFDKIISSSEFIGE